MWTENPQFAVPPPIFAVVDLWLDCKRFAASGMMGQGAMPLPCSGGVGEQPAALIDAFALLDGWSREGSEAR